MIHDERFTGVISGLLFSVAEGSRVLNDLCGKPPNVTFKSRRTLRLALSTKLHRAIGFPAREELALDLVKLNFYQPTKSTDSKRTRSAMSFSES